MLTIDPKRSLLLVVDFQSRLMPDWVKRVPRIYLIDPTALAYVGEICALDNESGSGGSAA